MKTAADVLTEAKTGPFRQARRVGFYKSGEYERSVTVASRLYATGDLNLAEFRELLSQIRAEFNRAPGV